MATDINKPNDKSTDGNDKSKTNVTNVVKQIITNEQIPSFENVYKKVKNNTSIPKIGAKKR